MSSHFPLSKSDFRGSLVGFTASTLRANCLHTNKTRVCERSQILHSFNGSPTIYMQQERDKEPDQSEAGHQEKRWLHVREAQWLQEGLASAVSASLLDRFWLETPEES